MSKGSGAVVQRQDLPSLSVPKNDLIQFRKKSSEYWNVANKEAKPSCCLICNEPISGICNSHTIPQYCLKEIAKEGRLYMAAVLLDTNLIQYEVGVNEAATFKQICKKCDSEFFKLYETPETLLNRPSPRVLGQIATKNLLREMSKGRREIELKKALGVLSTPDLDAMTSVRAIDMEEDEKAFKKAVRVASIDSCSSAYHIIYHVVLPYVAPIAFHHMISLISDFDGNLINNEYIMNPGYRIEPIHVCILPSKGKTVVLVFRDERAKRYRSFEQQLRKLDKESQLLAILKIAFAYSEDVIISKWIPEGVLQDEALKQLARMNRGYIHSEIAPGVFDRSVLRRATHDFAVNNLPDPPNLLLSSYSIS